MLWIWTPAAIYQLQQIKMILSLVSLMKILAKWIWNFSKISVSCEVYFFFIFDVFDQIVKQLVKRRSMTFNVYIYFIQSISDLLNIINGSDFIWISLYCGGNLSECSFKSFIQFWIICIVWLCSWSPEKAHYVTEQIVVLKKKSSRAPLFETTISCTWDSTIISPANTSSTVDDMHWSPLATIKVN